MIDFKNFLNFKVRADWSRSRKKTWSTFTEEKESQQDPNFSQDGNNIPKKQKKREQQNQIIAIQKSRQEIY